MAAGKAPELPADTAGVCGAGFQGVSASKDLLGLLGLPVGAQPKRDAPWLPQLAQKVSRRRGNRLQTCRCEGSLGTNECCFAGCPKGQAHHGEAQWDPLHFAFDLLQFCFLDSCSSPPMESCCSSLPAELSPDGFGSSRECLVSMGSLADVLPSCCLHMLQAWGAAKGKKTRAAKSKALPS